MIYSRNETGRTRFYVPFILAFLVFSAVLATEYLIVRDLLEDSYRDQISEYHAISRHIIDGLNAYYSNSSPSDTELNSIIQSLGSSTGIKGLSIQIVRDGVLLNAYMDSSRAEGAVLEGIDLDNRVIETSIAKMPNNEYMILAAIEHNDKEIKYLEDISVALIIILIVMIIFAVVPGALMIESLTRRRRMAGSIISSSGPGSWEVLAEVFSGSSVTGCMAVSSGNEVIWANRLCREMLEMEEGTGFSLASVTSLPDKFRKGVPIIPQQPESELIKIRLISGEHIRLQMEVFPGLDAGDNQTRIITFIRPPADDSASGTGRGRGKSIGDPLEAGSPAAVQLVESIIHDMNNHLSGVIGSASLELDRSNSQSSTKEACSVILEAAEKLTDLCSELQSILTGEEDSVLRDPCDEMKLIAEVIRRILPDAVRFIVTGRCVKLVSVKRELLRDLIYNLSLNSTEMMNGEGRIKIDVSDRIPSGFNKIESISPGNRVCIRYSDGYIMPVALRDVLSSRKYSLQDVERQFGTTIGTLYRVLRDLDGKIVFERGSGETVLCIILEGYDRPLSSRDNTPDESDYSGVTGLSVLVADAVDIVLTSTCEYLEHRGMITTGVSDGDSAMNLLRTGKFDAAVLDLNMPGTSTPSIVRYCQTSFPTMAVVITTGYGMTGPVRDLIKATSTDCLYKPHRPEVLVETIYSTLMRIQEGESK